MFHGGNKKWGGTETLKDQGNGRTAKPRALSTKSATGAIPHLLVFLSTQPGEEWLLFCEDYDFESKEDKEDKSRDKY